MSAVITMGVTALRWTTAKRASVCKAFPIRCCASGSASQSSRWTRRCMPRSWSPGTRNAVQGVENFSRRRSTTACIARPVQRSERGKAKGHGRGKSGGMCRKSSVQNSRKYKGFERRSAGWQGVYTFCTENGLYFFYINAEKAGCSGHKWQPRPAFFVELFTFLW